MEWNMTIHRYSTPPRLELLSAQQPRHIQADPEVPTRDSLDALVCNPSLDAFRLGEAWGRKTHTYLTQLSVVLLIVWRVVWDLGSTRGHRWNVERHTVTRDPKL